MTAFDALAAIVRAGSGLVLGRDKLYLLETRLAPLLKREGFAGLDALAARLAGCGPDHGLVQDVLEAMTTNESLFFRDGTPFAHVHNVALPRLCSASRPVRVWSAAASSGQEAYSLAMIVEAAAATHQVDIVGTDLSREQVARARTGLFTQFEVQRGLPVRLLLKHFTQEPAGWRISAPLRAMCSFQRANLLGDLKTLGIFDLVFLRNLLIYFNITDKTRVLNLVADQMTPDGLLYLSAADSIQGLDTPFTALPGERGIYARSGPPCRPSAHAATRRNWPETLDPAVAHADVPIVAIDRRVAMARHEAQFAAERRG